MRRWKRRTSTLLVSPSSEGAPLKPRTGATQPRELWSFRLLLARTYRACVISLSATNTCINHAGAGTLQGRILLCRAGFAPLHESTSPQTLTVQCLHCKHMSANSTSASPPETAPEPVPYIFKSHAHAHKQRHKPCLAIPLAATVPGCGQPHSRSSPLHTLAEVPARAQRHRCPLSFARPRASQFERVAAPYLCNFSLARDAGHLPSPPLPSPCLPFTNTCSANWTMLMLDRVSWAHACCNDLTRKAT